VAESGPPGVDLSKSLRHRRITLVDEGGWREHGPEGETSGAIEEWCWSALSRVIYRDDAGQGREGDRGNKGQTFLEARAQGLLNSCKGNSGDLAIMNSVAFAPNRTCLKKKEIGRRRAARPQRYSDAITVKGAETGKITRAVRKGGCVATTPKRDPSPHATTASKAVGQPTGNVQQRTRRLKKG